MGVGVTVGVRLAQTQVLSVVHNGFLHVLVLISQTSDPGQVVFPGIQD